jgi:hypothetical protein
MYEVTKYKMEYSNICGLKGNCVVQKKEGRLKKASIKGCRVAEGC